MPETHRPAVELLAPAGSPDALVAAVNNGADAVYLGLGELNARRGAANFDLESLAQATRFAHLRDARVYLTANVVVLPQEFEPALVLVDGAWAAGVDAVIVQDLGLLRAVRLALPDVRIHASTQIDAMNPDTVQALARAGASRVTLARELSLEAIAACATAGVEVETFVHGALCYCYSGQCLLSSMIGRRSANRGLCAQPCRLTYDLFDASGEAVAAPGRYLLSPKDLAGIAHLPALISAGVRALKIEGRMKSPEYVAVVTGVYRAALDRALADPEGFGVSPAEWEMLEEAFNRGFTDGYLTGERREALMSYTRPNNRGVLVGRIVQAAPGSAAIELERALDPADTLEVWTHSGRFAQSAGALSVGGASVHAAPAGSTVTFVPERTVAVGDRVFRVANDALLRAARRTFAGSGVESRRATPVDFEVSVRVGLPLRLVARAAGEVAEAEGAAVAPARTKPITAEEIVEHVGRLGGTGYEAGSWDIDLDAGAGLGFSALHALRREALERLDAARLAPWAARERRRPSVPALPPAAARTRAVSLVATAWSEEVAAACRDAGADVAMMRVFGAPATEAASMAPAAPVSPLLPRVAWPAEVALYDGWAGAEHLAAGNLGLLTRPVGRGAPGADWPLNVLNAHAAAALAEQGAGFVWASPELSGRQLADLAGASPLPVGCVVWGRLELMVAEQCVLQAAGECGRRCASCARRQKWWRLRDQKGYEFPVTTDPSGRSHIVNSVTLDLIRALDEIVATGVAAVRLDFTDEDPARAAEVVRAFRSALNGVEAGGDPPAVPIVEPSTSGHFYRGVL
ncbi:MAG: U32 family peptidase [Actinobacteria bacterium]|nr:U32 family peptidase [Actinomycetota bacterium]